MTEREKIEIAAIMARCGASEGVIKDAIRDMERQDNSQLRSWAWATNYSGCKVLGVELKELAG